MFLYACEFTPVGGICWSRRGLVSVLEETQTSCSGCSHTGMSCCGPIAPSPSHWFLWCCAKPVLGSNSGNLMQPQCSAALAFQGRGWEHPVLLPWGEGRRGKDHPHHYTIRLGSGCALSGWKWYDLVSPWLLMPTSAPLFQFIPAWIFLLPCSELGWGTRQKKKPKKTQKKPQQPRFNFNLDHFHNLLHWGVRGCGEGRAAFF